MAVLSLCLQLRSENLSLSLSPSSGYIMKINTTKAGGASSARQRQRQVTYADVDVLYT